MNIVKLRNGAEVPEPLAGAIWLTLQAVMDRHPIALYEAVMIARDARHAPFGNTGTVLREYELIDDRGVMNSAVRDIVRSAVDGEDWAMCLVWPVDMPEVPG